MSDLLKTVVVMTITGSVLALALFALKPFVKNRLPKAAQYYLWLVVLAALLVPFSRFVTLPQTPVSAPIAPISQAVEQMTLTPAEEFSRWQNDPVRPQTQEESRRFKENRNAWLYLAYLYPFGAAAVLIYTVITFAVFTRKLKRRNVLTDIKAAIPVYRNPLASTPMLIGFFQPSIVLPDKEYTDEQLNAVVAHEATHHRRKDVLVRWLTVAACAVHWFNPLVWLVRREIDRACELSCDEAVIRNLDVNGKQKYGDTLLYVAADAKARRSALAMCEEKRDLKERLVAIMKSKKRGVLAVCVSAALLVTLAACAVALGAGSGNGSGNTFYWANFTVNGFGLGMDVAAIDTAALTPVTPLDIKDSYEYNFAEARYSADKFTGLIRKMYIDVINGAEISSVTMNNGTAIMLPSDVLRDIEQVKTLFGDGKSGWQDRGQGLRYVEYTQKDGRLAATVRFVYSNTDGRLVWVIADSTLPYPAPYNDAAISVDDDYFEQTGSRLPTVQVVLKDRDTLEFHRLADFQRFSFSWFANGKGAANDTIAPWEAEWNAENTVTLPVETLFDVRTSQRSAQGETKGNYRIYKEDGGIVEESSQETGIISDYVLITPLEPGVYFYEVELRYVENDLRANYAVKMIVEPIGSGARERDPNNRRQMTLADIRAISQKLGEDLTLNDLGDFIGDEIGSGLYIMRYLIDGGYQLRVGAMKPDSPIEYAYFGLADGDFTEDERIDIRYYDVDTFLAGEKKPIARNAVPPQFAPPLETAAPLFDPNVPFENRFDVTPNPEHYALTMSSTPGILLAVSGQASGAATLTYECESGHFLYWEGDSGVIKTYGNKTETPFGLMNFHWAPDNNTQDGDLIIMRLVDENGGVIAAMSLTVRINGSYYSLEKSSPVNLEPTATPKTE